MASRTVNLDALIQELSTAIHEHTEKIVKQEKARIDEMAQFAEDQMFFEVSHAYTPTGLSGRPKGRIGAGRTVTGEFRDAIENRLLQNSDNTYSRGVGWYNPKDYYVYQEGGFTHWISGKWITGVRAVRTTAQDIINTFKR